MIGSGLVDAKEVIEHYAARAVASRLKAITSGQNGYGIMTGFDETRWDLIPPMRPRFLRILLKGLAAVSSGLHGSCFILRHGLLGTLNQNVSDMIVLKWTYF